MGKDNDAQGVQDTFDGVVINEERVERVEPLANMKVVEHGNGDPKLGL